MIVIDPGVALGAWRYGLPPHPLQIATGRVVRRLISEALEGATDLVFSHFHGDHVPLAEANPYQLAFSHLPRRFTILRAWSLAPEARSEKDQQRAHDRSHPGLDAALGPSLRPPLYRTGSMLGSA